MRNGGNSKTSSKIARIIEVAKRLPLFTIDNLASIETNKKYLRIVLSRYVKSGILVRLKKGVYVAKEYLDNIEKKQRAVEYAEFLACVLYEPSYLSLEYILHKHGVLTESTIVVTAVSLKKTASFNTTLGAYRYHAITDRLFVGFDSKRNGEYLIHRASLAKALFDFLYFRKNHLKNDEAVKELRLNLGILKAKDKRELANYVKLEGSKLMKNIYTKLWKN